MQPRAQPICGCDCGCAHACTQPVPASLQAGAAPHARVCGFHPARLPARGRPARRFKGFRPLMYACMRPTSCALCRWPARRRSAAASNAAFAAHHGALALGGFEDDASTPEQLEVRRAPPRRHTMAGVMVCACSWPSSMELQSWLGMHACRQQQLPKPAVHASLCGICCTWVQPDLLAC